MLKFFKDLFSSKPKDDKMVVKNMPNDVEHDYETIPNKGLKKVQDQKMFYVLTSQITEIKDDKSGLIQEIELIPKVKFEEITLTDDPIVEEKHRGVSTVQQKIHLKYEKNEILYEHLLENANNNKKISILYIDEFQRCFLFGENIGLDIEVLTTKEIHLQGEEKDVFYKVTYDCAKSLIE